MKKQPIIITIAVVIFLATLIFFETTYKSKKSFSSLVETIEKLPETAENIEIKYGLELFNNTPIYIGPEGLIGSFAKNKMSCKNCHLDSGTRHYGGSLLSTHGNYPQFRERDGKIITLADRINQCIERPLHGQALPPHSRELKALLSYMKWLAQNQLIGRYNVGDKITYLEEMPRPASPSNGKSVYLQHCASCHGEYGQGRLMANKKIYQYPPLWGEDSYTIGSSMHRVRMAAAFIKFNMPYGTTHTSPVLSTAQALDVASYINSQPRPVVNIKSDYPNLSDKPTDYPYGPYSDSFSELEHQLGPWERMKKL